jgi:histone-lysine N-methyltransferase SETMAR
MRIYHFCKVSFLHIVIGTLLTLGDLLLKISLVKLALIYYILSHFVSESLSSMDEERLKYRAVIEFLVKKGKEPSEILADLTEVYKDAAPSTATTYRWIAEFKRGRTLLHDEQRCGRPTTSTTVDNVAAVEKLVMADRHITIAQLAEEVGVSKGIIGTILHEHLGMHKVCAKLVPRFLTPTMRADRVQISKQLLSMFQADRTRFFNRIITGDETWVRYWEPKSKQQSKEWKRTEEQTPVQSKVERSAGKLLMTVFWDAQGILMVDYLPRNETINADYYSNLMSQLRREVKEKRRGKLSSHVLLLHDNSPVHKAHSVSTAIHQCGYSELPHPAYSPDLAPSDYYLFSALKTHLRGKRYVDDQSLKAAVQDWFAQREEDFFARGIKLLEERWHLCIERDGHYVET